MTTNIHDLIEKAYSLGRAHGAELARITEGTVQRAPAPRPITVAKPVAAPPSATKEPKAPKVARGVRQASGPRTKGVKEAIMNLIGASEGLSTKEVIANTGFKPASVNATLMALKKNGIASQDGKAWFLTATAASGNTEADHAHADY